MLSEREKAIYYIVAVDGFVRHLGLKNKSLSHDELHNSWARMLDHARMSQFYGLPEEEFVALLDDCSKESESHLKMVEQMVSYMENKRIGGV